MTSMPQAVASNQSGTCAEEVVLGVDTHKDTHVAAVVTVLGGVIECKAFPTTAAGYRSLLGVCWAGHAALAWCAEPGWNAPARTVPG